MADCPNCEYHKQRAQIWRDEVYRLTGHPLPRKEKSMTQNEIIELARQAGFKYADVEGIWITAGFWDKELTAFAKLVEEKERKRILDVIGDNQCECRCAEVVRGQT